MVLMNYNASLVAGFTFLTTVVTAANLPLYLCCALALIVATRRGGAPGAGKVAVSLLGLAFVAWAFVGMGSEPFWMALGLAAAGLPVYFVLRALHARARKPVSPSVP